VTHTIGPCDLDWHNERPALVLACPGRDMIRVWPLPVEQPGWADVKPAGGAGEADRRLPSGDGDAAVHRDNVGGQIDITADQGRRRPRE
jgi:hypothetical protein